MQKFSDFFAKKMKIFPKNWRPHSRNETSSEKSNLKQQDMNDKQGKTPEILWAQSPINFKNPRPHKSYEPKAPKHCWAQSPINFKNPRPHKHCEPKAP